MRSHHVISNIDKSNQRLSPFQLCANVIWIYHTIWNQMFYHVPHKLTLACPKMWYSNNLLIAHSHRNDVAKNNIFLSPFNQSIWPRRATLVSSLVVFGRPCLRWKTYYVNTWLFALNCKMKYFGLITYWDYMVWLLEWYWSRQSLR